MRLWDANWMQIERYLERDDRVIVPLGSTEQHGYLSLGVDAILAERACVEASQGEGVPVAPVVPYGLTPMFTAYPGTITLRLSTYIAIVRDLLDGLSQQGFRRIMIVSGHGGNAPAANIAQEWVGDNPDTEVLFHSWLIDPAIWSFAGSIAPATHSNWVENLPFVRIPGVEIPPGGKPVVDQAATRVANPAGVRELMGDGPGGGDYQRPDADVEQVWAKAVELLATRLRDGWRKPCPLTCRTAQPLEEDRP